MVFVHNLIIPTKRLPRDPFLLKNTQKDLRGCFVTAPLMTLQVLKGTVRTFADLMKL